MLKYKINRKLITLKCEFCGKEFEKPISEYERNKKVGRSNYCSLNCSGKSCNKNNKQKGNMDALKLAHIAIKDRLRNYPEYRFTYYLRNARRRKKEFSLTLLDLDEQWKKQHGLCPYSGIKLMIATHTKNHNNPIYNASLDRIDSSKGYIKGNIQFVSTCLNYMKNTLSHNETVDLCKQIANKWS